MKSFTWLAEKILSTSMSIFNLLYKNTRVLFSSSCTYLSLRFRSMRHKGIGFMNSHRWLAKEITFERIFILTLRYSYIKHAVISFAYTI